MKWMAIKPQITSIDETSLQKYFKEVSRLSTLPTELENKLIIKAQQGDKKAIENVMKGNLRFVISIAKQYSNKGLPLSDLISEGNLGLLEAIQKYDIEKNVKFITYAVFWIRQYIMGALSTQSRTVRLPLNHLNAVNKVLKVTSKAKKHEQRELTVKEISDTTGLLTEKVIECISIPLNSVSLDDCGNTDLPLIETIEVVNEKEHIDEEATKIVVDRILNLLPSRDRIIIQSLYGINMEPLSQQDLASRLGLCEERIRQLHIEIMEKLKREHKNELLSLWKHLTLIS